VKEQIAIAAGRKLNFTQDKVRFKGHAMECRINAEDPDNNFMPSPGRVEEYMMPGGPHIRIDSSIYAGYQIPPYYDSMIAKILAHGEDRQETINIMLRALKETTIGPIKTTLSLHEKILNRPRFRQGAVSTKFIDTYIAPKKLDADSKKKAG
jgi:acetyl-CoA carboxylase biotin carboxylase subunit